MPRRAMENFKALLNMFNRKWKCLRHKTRGNESSHPQLQTVRDCVGGPLPTSYLTAQTTSDWMSRSGSESLLRTYICSAPSRALAKFRHSVTLIENFEPLSSNDAGLVFSVVTTHLMKMSLQTKPTHRGEFLYYPLPMQNQ